MKIEILKLLILKKKKFKELEEMQRKMLIIEIKHVKSLGWPQVEFLLGQPNGRLA